jgi:sulfite exporter TauE/SafE/copper chaperone CopZ
MANRRTAARKVAPHPAPPRADVTTPLAIEGMTCRSCEVRVARALRGLPGVVRAEASARQSTATVVSTRALDLDAARGAVEQAGYQLGESQRRWVSRDRQVWRDVALGVAVAALLGLAWRVGGLDRLGIALTQGAMGGNVAFVVLLGVAASLSTCMALVGGVVIGLSARFAQTHPTASRAQRLRPQAMFNLGRILGFAALGAAVGGVGSVLAVRGPVFGVLIVAVAVVMGWLGVKLTGVSPRLARISLTLPPVLTRWMVRDDNQGGAYRDSSALLAGAASFFLPCGVTQAVQVYALSTGSPLQAGLAMGLFAVGTTPGLMGVGALSSRVSTAGAKRFFRFVGVAVLAFSLVNLASGVSVLSGGAFSPAGTMAAAQRSANVHDVDGVQVAEVTIDWRGYTPAVSVVYAGMPIRWQFKADTIGCQSMIDASQLGVAEPIRATADISVDLAALEPGTYPYQCVMGMVHGRFVAIDPPADPAGGPTPR